MCVYIKTQIYPFQQHTVENKTQNLQHNFNMQKERSHYHVHISVKSDYSKLLRLQGRNSTTEQI